MNLSHSSLGIVAIAGLTLAGTPASAQGLQHFAVLSGGNEVNAAGKANAGDPNGSGAVALSLDRAGTRLCVTMVVQLLDTPTMAHIHARTAGVNGPIAVTLTPPNAGNPGSSTTCVTGLAAALTSHIREKPGDFYVNVHTTAFPAGAIRGQLF
jgi:hypothetical protein